MFESENVLEEAAIMVVNFWNLIRGSEDQADAFVIPSVPAKI
jgi:hypothetical protein